MWIASGITEQVQITSLNNFFIWWSSDNLWRNCKKTKKYTINAESIIKDKNEKFIRAANGT